MNKVSRSIIAGVMVFCVAAGFARADNDPGSKDVRLRLVLHQAFTKSPQQTAGCPTAIITMVRSEGLWSYAVATAMDFNQHEHTGHVIDAQVGDSDIALDLIFNVRGDAWVPGGRAQYSVSLEKQPDGSFTGKYTGTIRNIDVAGEANADLLPMITPERPAAGLREHPRLLFRKEDVPEIRARAATRLGELALAEMTNSPAASAFRYVLTGDRTHADDAQRRIEEMMPDRGHGQNNVLSRYYAWRLEQAALAFDMCYDAWDEPFRRKVSDYMLETANLIMHNRATLQTRIRWGHQGPHAPALFYAAAIAGLTIADEPGPEPQKPVPPHLLSEAGGMIEPESATPGKEVPVTDFNDGVLPEEWIYVGPFPNTDDPLADDSRRAAMRPAVGTALGDGEHRQLWRTVANSNLVYQGRSSGNVRKLELTGPSGVAVRTISYYYKVLRNDSERWVKVQTGHGGVDMYLGGVRVREGDVVKLKPGLYPWLFSGPIGVKNPWAKSFAEPRLTEVDDETVEAVRRQAATAHSSRLAAWELDHNRWQSTHGADLRYQTMAATALHIMEMCYAEMLGKGGHLSGGAELVGMDGPNRYAFIHRNVTGRNPGAHDEAADYIIRTAFVHPYRQDRAIVNQEINGTSGFITAQYPEGGRDLAPDHFAALFPVIRREWQPAALWLWQYHTGGSLTDDETIRKLVRAPGRAYPFHQPYGDFNLHPLIALLNYPLDMQPAHPQGILPRVWQAPDFGFYGFRNTWNDKPEQFIVQLFSATYEEGAGTLRVSGFGHVWSHGLDELPSGARFFENVVQLPGIDITAGARADVTYVQQDDDGSGALSLDLSPVYAAPVLNNRGLPLPLYEWYGRIPRKDAWADSGISGARAMAVDYSGKSGAPCLIVIVDTFAGTREAVWSWQLQGKRAGIMAHKNDKNLLPEDYPRREELYTAFKAAVDGKFLSSDTAPAQDERINLLRDGFVMQQGDASMRVTFVAPSRPRLELAERIQRSRTNIEVMRVDTSTAVYAYGRDAFFTILTFQEGDAPAVKTLRGRGLNSVVQVGGQTVRFDGEKVVFGE